MAEFSSDSFNMLELHSISKRFGNLQALSNVSLDLRPGTVHALLGENGAGKSTLMRIAFGMINPDKGEIRIDGHPVYLRSPRAAIEAGIGMVHQHFMLVPAMTVAENVELGGRGSYDARQSAVRIRQLIEETGLTLDPSTYSCRFQTPSCWKKSKRCKNCRQDQRRANDAKCLLDQRCTCRSCGCNRGTWRHFRAI